jgi:O-antigen/teichoic acid export membrane protein
MPSLTAGQGMALPRILSWAKRGGFAVLDQGLFSGANFIVNVLLARWLEPAQFGVFVLAYAVFLFLGVIHTAVLTEPMVVFGAGKYAEKFREYLGILIYGHWGITGMISLVLALSALAFWRLDSAEVARALASAAVASPFILFLWLVRRAFYAALQPKWAAAGGMLYALLMLAGLYVLYRQQWLSSASALIVMGLSSLVTSIGFLRLLQPRWNSVETDPSVGMVLRDHWQYGRWAASSEVLISLHNNLYSVLVTSILGLSSVAGFKALQNLVTPIAQFLNALTLLFLPRSARRFSKNGSSAFKDAVNISSALTIAAFLYWLLVTVYGAFITHSLYAGKYDNYIEFIPYMAFTPILTAIRIGPNILQKATQRSDLVLISHLCSASFSVAIGWAFVLAIGILGSAISLNISLFVGASMAWCLWALKKKG